MAVDSNGSLDCLKTTDDVVARLKGELDALGIVLPSLRVDPLTAACDEPFPLVELGRCNLATARKLAAVLAEVRR